MTWRILALFLLVLLGCQHSGGELVGLAVHPKSSAAASGSQPNNSWVAQWPNGSATLVLRIIWPRRVQSLPPSTDRVSLTVRLPSGMATPSIPDLQRNSTALPTVRSIELPAGVPLGLRATAFASGSVVAQSLWNSLTLARNAYSEVSIELFPATGSNMDAATISVPQVLSVSPDRGYPGISREEIDGLNLGYSQGFGTVSFGGQPAGQVEFWSQEQGGSARISVKIPRNAQAGSVQVQLGSSGELLATFPGTFSDSDPWSGHFSLLGPVGDAFTLASGIADATHPQTLLGSDASRFWVAWVATASLGVSLQAECLTPDARHLTRKVSIGPALPVATASAISLGGMVPDSTGTWLAWEDAGTASPLVKLAHVSDAGVVAPLLTVSSSASANGHPVLAKAGSGSLLVAWIDDRDSSGGISKPRVYVQAVSAAGAAVGAPVPAQRSNGPLDRQTVLTSNPAIATDGSRFVVLWQESGAESSSLEWQMMAPDGNRLVSDFTGATQEAGPDSLQYSNNLLDGVSTGFEEPQVAFNPQTGDFGLVYSARIGGMTGTRSNVCFRKLDSSSPVIVSDDSRVQGILSCPSLDLGTPCGQGLRLWPQLVWNGRDYFVAWEMDRSDGEQDILGARLGVDGSRAPEEPPSIQSSVSLPRSVAEILFTFASGSPQTSAPGPQTNPHLAWAGDIHLISWLEPQAGGVALRARLWR